MSKREVISCLSLACVALISSRSPERASLGGFPAGKREILSLHGNRSVERLEEQLLLYLEYHPQVAWYGRGDSSSTFASTYKIATPLPTPYTIDYLFEGKAHVYLPDAIGQLLDGRFLIAEAGLEQDKRRERNRAKAEAARKVAEQQAGVYWIGTEATLSRTRHANLVFLHARRQAFPAWSQLEEAGPRRLALGRSGLCAGTGRTSGRTLAPGGTRSCRLETLCRERRDASHLLVDLTSVSLTRLTPLICLPSDSMPILPDPLPSELSESRSSFLEEVQDESDQRENQLTTFDDSTLEGPVRERFLRNVRAVEQVLAGSSAVEVAQETQIARSTLLRLVQRTRTLGVRACVPYARLLPRKGNASGVSRSHSPPLPVTDEAVIDGYS